MLIIVRSEGRMVIVVRAVIEEVSEVVVGKLIVAARTTTIVIGEVETNEGMIVVLTAGEMIDVPMIDVTNEAEIREEQITAGKIDAIMLVGMVAGTADSEGIVVREEGLNDV